ncbi:MAG: RNA-binding domain-containing protein [Sulfolobus sp.]
MKAINIEISVFCHETEDREKILSSIQRFFDSDIKSAKFEDNIVSGYYGNKIEIISFKATGKVANSIFQRILNSLDKFDLLLLISTLSERLDRGKLHLRIDKQKLISQGKIFLKDGDDVIKVIITLKDSQNLEEELKSFANRNES